MAKQSSNTKSKRKPQHAVAGAARSGATPRSAPPSPESVARGVAAAVVEQVAAAFESVEERR